MTKNIIAFQKGLIIIPNIGIDNRNMAMNVQAELMSFGYMLTQDALEQLGHADSADIIDFHNEIINYLRTMTGGLRDYKPIYPGFPEQVMQMKESELWYNQLLGYWSGGSFTAEEWTEPFKTAFEHVEYKIIDLGTEEEFMDIFKSLASSGQSLTPNDSKVILWFIEHQPNLEFPEVIPFKENLCSIIGKLVELKRPLDTVKLPKLTTTDVLRIVVFLSGGDISLPAVPSKTISVRSGWRGFKQESNPKREMFKFKKFKRSERRTILGLLEASNLDVKEMKLKDQRWIRIGEILHPGEFQHQFPRAYKAFNLLRNEKISSWYGDVQRAFDLSFSKGLNKLAERPGEFMRRLDYLVRNAKGNMLQQILDVFSKIAIGSSNKVLFEVYTHFEERREMKFNRSIMIKGARKRTKLPDLPAIDSEVVDMIQSKIFETIKEKFKSLSEIGDCWIDEELKKIPLPTNMRTLNDSLVPLIRGQRVPVPGEKTVLRSFIHWYDERGNLDIDLHGYLFGSNNIILFGYNGTYRSNFGCYSGDVRNRKGACAEYVDIDINKAAKENYRYFLMIAHNFNGGSLSDIKECVAGVMERDNASANSLWRPDTIQNCILLTSSARMTMIGVYDLFTREYIHLDLDFGNFQQYVSRNRSGEFFEALKPYIELPKVSVYDLLLWHVEARGRLVSKETAQTHFLFDDFKSSYTKTIEYMGI